MLSSNWAQTGPKLQIVDNMSNAQSNTLKNKLLIYAKYLTEPC